MNEFVALLANQGAAVVFVATLAARLGAPVPAVPFLIVAGGLSYSGQLSFLALVAAALVGNILGDAAWFLAGRRWGYRVMRLLCRVSLSADTCVARSENIITRWGGASLIAAKFVPGVSVVAPPMAGALGMSNQRFLAYETLAALIWTLLFLLVGWLFHAAIAQVLGVLTQVGVAATAAIAVALVLFLGWRYYQRRAALRALDVERIEVEALRHLLAQGGLCGALPGVIDVRSDEARALDARRVPGAVGIPLGQLPQALGPLADGRELVVYCDCPDDASAISAARVLRTAGVPRVRVLAGGIDAWVAMQAALDAVATQGLPVSAVAVATAAGEGESGLRRPAATA